MTPATRAGIRPSSDRNVPRVCLPYRPDANRRMHALDSRSRLRLFVVDLPEGSSMQTLAITVMPTDEHFEKVVDDASPIIDSIEFHAP